MSQTQPLHFTQGHTGRGFPYIKFFDRYNALCSVQKSSLAFEDAIWLGVDDADPKILASKTPQGGTGWVPYHIPDDVSLTTRMHLTREQVAQLLPVLQTFVKTGELPANAPARLGKTFRWWGGRSMDKRQIALCLFIFVLCIPVAYGSWIVTKRINYAWQYEDMVRATVRKMVKPETLRVPQ